MGLHRLFSLPRQARSALAGLADASAAVREVPRPILLGQLEIGWIRELVWRRRRVSISGDAAGTEVVVGFDGFAPHHVAGDGFQFDIERPPDRTGLVMKVRTRNGDVRLVLPPPPPSRKSLARLSAVSNFLAEVFAERSAVLSFLRSGDPAAAARLRHRFGLAGSAKAFWIPPDLFGASKQLRAIHAAVIVLPVFNAYDDLVRLLSRLPQSLPDDHRIVFVDDASDDTRIAGLLRDYQALWPETAKVIRLPENRGFVAAANAGLAAAQVLSDGHVVLLNSDTLPPDDWMARLLAPILSDPNVASVTPLSNAGEILSVPGEDPDDMPDTALVAAMDRVAGAFSEAHSSVGVPTGIGFCMALNRRFLDRIGGFDPAFGWGYGEEVDWCRKASAVGGRHVAATNLFVAHRGGASFDADVRRARLRAAGRVIARRYPNYGSDVQTWARAAPIAPHRLAISMAWLAGVSPVPVPIFLGHMLGGGAETGLQREIAAILGGGAPGVVVLRAGGRERWRIELTGPRLSQVAEVADDALLLRLLKPLIAPKVVYSCGVGAYDPLSVPQLLHDLVERGGQLALRLHDYFPISPSWNLIGSDGRYSGPPLPDTIDPAHGIARGSGRAAVTNSEWRRHWAKVISRASENTAYSRSSIDIFTKAYPQAAGKMTLCAHDLTDMPSPMAPGGGTIGVLGGINLAKGAEVLQALAELDDFKRRITVIGEIDGQFSLPPPHVVHGRYDRDAIGRLAREYDVGLWLIPSICPETFSFATHEALATGLPVVSFDLGAQADALADAENGHVFNGGPDDVASLAAQIEAQIKS